MHTVDIVIEIIIKMIFTIIGIGHGMINEIIHIQSLQTNDYSTITHLCMASRLDWLWANSNIRRSWGAPDWISRDYTIMNSDVHNGNVNRYV